MRTPPKIWRRHQPVPRKPVAEDGREDRLHREDDRRPSGGDVLLGCGLSQVGQRRRHQPRGDQRHPHPGRGQGDGIEERSQHDEDQRHGEDLGQRQGARAVG
jgi:hypothetical protein